MGMKERYFLVCYFNGIGHGRNFVLNDQGRFVNIAMIERLRKCTVTFVFEFQTKEDWIDAQNEGV